MLNVMSEVTQILSAIEAGDPQAAEQLLPLVYEELRKLAAQRLAEEKPGQTLQATALVHEAYLRLVGDQQFDNRGHFFAAAAEAMRRILIENARKRATVKRGGGGGQRLPFDLVQPVAIDQPDEMIALSEALEKLEAHDAKKATLVKLRYFAGLTMEESAAVLGISLATANRTWRYVRAWLYQELRGNGLEISSDS
jgi:RNA polymerase sigma factor (TIGR02999 family)